MVEARNYIITSRTMMQGTASACVQTMNVLRKSEQKETSYLMSFYILAAIALELYAKALITTTKEVESPISKVEKSFREFGHNLELLYSEKGVGNNFLTDANISQVKRVMDDVNFVYRYDFSLITTKQPLYIYDTESLRYGLLAGEKTNPGVVGYQFDEVLNLCLGVEKALSDTLYG